VVARLAPHELDKPASLEMRAGGGEIVSQLVHMQPSRSTSRLESIMGGDTVPGCGGDQADHGSDHHDTERQRYRLNKCMANRPG
jgi:hypothetical protein